MPAGERCRSGTQDGERPSGQPSTPHAVHRVGPAARLYSPSRIGRRLAGSGPSRLRFRWTSLSNAEEVHRGYVQVHTCTCRVHEERAHGSWDVTCQHGWMKPAQRSRHDHRPPPPPPQLASPSVSHPFPLFCCPTWHPAPPRVATAAAAAAARRLAAAGAAALSRRLFSPHSTPSPPPTRCSRRPRRAHGRWSCGWRASSTTAATTGCFGSALRGTGGSFATTRSSTFFCPRRLFFVGGRYAGREGGKEAGWGGGRWEGGCGDGRVGMGGWGEAMYASLLRRPRSHGRDERGVVSLPHRWRAAERRCRRRCTCHLHDSSPLAARTVAAPQPLPPPPHRRHWVPGLGCPAAGTCPPPPPYHRRAHQTTH